MMNEDAGESFAALIEQLKALTELLKAQTEKIGLRFQHVETDNIVNSHHPEALAKLQSLPEDGWSVSNDHTHRFEMLEDRSGTYFADLFQHQCGKEVRFLEAKSDNDLLNLRVSDDRIALAPKKDFAGSAGFKIRYEDEEGRVHVETVEVEISAINDAPRIVADIPTLVADPQKKFHFDLKQYFSDVDGDDLSFSIDPYAIGRDVASIIRVDSEKATISGIMPGGFRASFTVRANDGDGAETAHVFNIVASNTKSPLAAHSDIVHLTNGNLMPTVFFEDFLLRNDTHVGGGQLRFNGITTHPRGGFIDELENGTYRYKPDEDFNEWDSCKYLVSDCTHEGECSETTTCGNFDIATVYFIPM